MKSKSDIAKTFGKVLRQKRLDAKLSQEKLANLCNLDRTYISLMERGFRQPTLHTLFNISEVLKLSPELLIREVSIQLK